MDNGDLEAAFASSNVVSIPSDVVVVTDRPITVPAGKRITGDGTLMAGRYFSSNFLVKMEAEAEIDGALRFDGTHMPQPYLSL